MEISYMTIKDFEEIQDIIQEEFDNFWNSNILKSELINPITKYIVAKENFEIVGFAGILIAPDDVEVMNIVVKKSMRRKGIGEKLLKELIKISKETNLNILNLEVNVKNIAAKNLYEKLGFRIIRN